jgi:hypothetical protein
MRKYVSFIEFKVPSKHLQITVRVLINIPRLHVTVARYSWGIRDLSSRLGGCVKR